MLAAAAESKTAKKREEMSKWGKCNIVKSSKRTTKSLSTLELLEIFMRTYSGVVNFKTRRSSWEAIQR